MNGKIVIDKRFVYFHAALTLPHEVKVQIVDDTHQILKCVFVMRNALSADQAFFEDFDSRS